MKAILQHVRLSLLPNESGIRAELLKLNIYRKGDFFVEHRDTPRDAASVGSLVVVLPTAHGGGDLILHHRGESHTFLTAEKLAHSGGYFGSNKADGSYEWRSFYGTNYGAETQIRNVDYGIAKPLVPYIDCRHEIKQVAAGVRLTLSFQLLREDKPHDEEDVTKDEESGGLKAGATDTSCATNS